MAGDDVFWARVQHIITESLTLLDDRDRGERIAWCQRTGQHGVRAEPEPGGGMRFTWGGRTLAVVAAEVFDDDHAHADLRADLLPAAPDTIEGLS